MASLLEFIVFGTTVAAHMLPAKHETDNRRWKSHLMPVSAVIPQSSGCSVPLTYKILTREAFSMSGTQKETDLFNYWAGQLISFKELRKGKNCTVLLLSVLNFLLHIFCLLINCQGKLVHYLSEGGGNNNDIQICIGKHLYLSRYLKYSSTLMFTRLNHCTIRYIFLVVFSCCIVPVKRKQIYLPWRTRNSLKHAVCHKLVWASI